MEKLRQNTKTKTSKSKNNVKREWSLFLFDMANIVTWSLKQKEHSWHKICESHLHEMVRFQFLRSAIVNAIWVFDQLDLNIDQM